MPQVVPLLQKAVPLAGAGQGVHDVPHVATDDDRTHAPEQT
jgi:hypothetical protein